MTLNNGSITYLANSNYNGADSFTYTISDGQGGLSQATVNLVVAAVNDGPVAVGDALNAIEDTPLVISAASLLANDTDIDGNTLTVQSVTNGANGTVTLNNGSITYLANSNYNGADSFSYTISDGQGGLSQATVNLTVGAVNDAPIAMNDNFQTNADQLLTGNLFNDNGNGIDSDIDSNFTVTKINGVNYTPDIPLTLASGAILTVNANGGFNYQINSGNVPTFTGNANTDFASLSNAITFTDSFGFEDVALPPGWTLGASGWDMNKIHLVYDPVNDTLYVGIDTFGIFGDADGNGNPGSTSAQLAARGGVDLPNLTGSEQFTMMFDVNPLNGFNADFVAGVSSSSSSSIATFNLYQGASGPLDNLAYGPVVAGGLVSLHANPSAANPDLEFSISNFTQTLGINASDGFNFNIYAGSASDSGIGDDTLVPLGQSVHVSLVNDVTDSFTYTIDDGNGGVDTATVHIDIFGLAA